MKSGKWFGKSVTILSEWLLNPKIQKKIPVSYRIHSIKRRGVYFIFSVSDAAFIQGRRLFRNHRFLKSLTTVTFDRLYILCTSKVALFLLIILTRENRNCLDGADYQLVPSFFLIILFWLGAAFIRGRHFLVILLPSAAFNRINTVNEQAYWMFMYD